MFLQFGMLSALCFSGLGHLVPVAEGWAVLGCRGDHEGSCLHRAAERKRCLRVSHSP